MATATITISPIGAVKLPDNPPKLQEINLVGALSRGGEYVNVKLKKVSRNKSAESKAHQHDEFCRLIRLQDSYYQLAPTMA